MKRKLISAVAVPLFISLSTLSAIAQQTQASLKSYEQARRVLDAAIEAHGGLEAMRAIHDFTLKEKGKVIARFQSPRPDPPYSVGPSEETVVVDNQRGLLSYELKAANGGFNNWIKTIINGTTGVTLDMWSKTATPIVNPSLQNFRGQFRRLPHVILLEALDRAPTLRWLGEEEFNGKKQHVISVIRPDGQQLALTFDAETNLLTRYDFIYGDPMAGDSVIQQVYLGYRTIGKLKVPSGRALYNSGGLVQETDYVDVQFNVRPADSWFEVPSAFEKLPAPPATPAPPAVRKIADDVYWLEGLNGGTHNVLFVAFNDYVLVVEAPEATFYANNSAQALAKIKETLPGKPIKYLVLSHHHSDHAGGFREYVAEGATIVTTAGNKGFLERTAAISSSLISSAQPGRKPVIETIEKKRVFSDDKHVVELYDFGPNPHADEIIVAYLPKEKILFQADLLNPAANGTIAIAPDTTVSFAEKLRQSGLQVEKIYGVHGRPATPEELQRSVERRRQSELKIVTETGRR